MTKTYNFIVRYDLRNVDHIKINADRKPEAWSKLFKMLTAKDELIKRIEFIGAEEAVLDVTLANLNREFTKIGLKLYRGNQYWYLSDNGKENANKDIHALPETIVGGFNLCDLDWKSWMQILTDYDFQLEQINPKALQSAVRRS